MEDQAHLIIQSEREMVASTAEADSVDEAKYSNLPQIRATLTACIGGIAFGTVLGFSSPTIPQLQAQGILDGNDRESWFTAVSLLGAILGSTVAGILVEPIGRKLSIMVCTPVYVLGWLLIIAAGKYFTALLIGRIITGIAMGMCSFSVPLYITETATKDMRGTLGAFYQTSTLSGLIISYSIGILISWQWLAVVCTAIPLVMMVSMVSCPESPRWLLKNGKHQEALQALRWLRGPNRNVENEIIELESNMNIGQTSITFAEMKHPKFYRPSIIAFVLMAVQQLTGINVLGGYAQPIFKLAGFEKSASYAPIIMGAIALIFNFISCFLQDRVGRRMLLIPSAFICALSTGLLGLYFILQERTQVPPHWLALTSMTIFGAGFSMAMGPTVWVVMTEILPARAKGLIGSISTSINLIIAFILTKEFPDIEQSALHKYGAFWIFSVCTFIGGIFVILFVPETKGKSLEEIERHFESSSRELQQPRRIVLL